MALVLGLKVEAWEGGLVSGSVGGSCGLDASLRAEAGDLNSSLRGEAGGLDAGSEGGGGWGAKMLDLRGVAGGLGSRSEGGG